MKAEFYYKEEFPLELRITIEEIADLVLLRGMFLNAKDQSGVKGWAAYIGGSTVNDKKGADDMLEIVRDLGKNTADIYEEVNNVYVDQRRKEDDRRIPLQGEMAEGTETNN